MEEFIEKFKEIKNSIEINKNIILTAHVNPDGDAVGSGLGLFLTLKENYKDKDIRFILQDNIPYTTKFLKGAEEIEIYDKNKQYSCDILIFLDSATRDRTGETGRNIESKMAINIDHHISNPEYGDINCVIRYSSSTSEIIYNFIKNMNYIFSLSVAEALYLGLVNDTGNFSHSNVKVGTMQMATDLISMGVNNNYIVTNFLNSNSYETLKMMGEALKNFEFYSEKKLSYYYLDYETMKKYNAKKEDTEGIVEKILSYKDASVSLFLREEADGKIKGSMRSKYEINVNEIASLFGGGGHYKAAGFSSSLSTTEILEIVLKNI
ncbi:bifunctional oligoribonuclease/PAP phosphatase NrnA [Fusobacterium nucleatum]|uniref:DHH family phosphoesterase n=1 Tax=Fusobacterium nucleatum TaxID=851 RepID=UPI003D08960B